MTVEYLEQLVRESLDLNISLMKRYHPAMEELAKAKQDHSDVCSEYPIGSVQRQEAWRRVKELDAVAVRYYRIGEKARQKFSRRQQKAWIATGDPYNRMSAFLMSLSGKLHDTSR